MTEDEQEHLDPRLIRSTGGLMMKSGTEVNVLLDDGNIWRTRTRSEPWQLGHGQWVVALEGRAGGYDLDRVTEVWTEREGQQTQESRDTAAEAGMMTLKKLSQKRSVVNQFKSGLSMRVIAIFLAISISQVDDIIRAAIKHRPLS